MGKEEVSATWWRCDEWREKPEPIEVLRETAAFVFTVSRNWRGVLTSGRISKTSIAKTRRAALLHMIEQESRQIESLSNRLGSAKTKLAALNAEMEKETADTEAPAPKP